MKTIILRILVTQFCLMLILLNSCQIDKRIYHRGYIFGIRSNKIHDNEDDVIISKASFQAILPDVAEEKIIIDSIVPYPSASVDDISNSCFDINNCLSSENTVGVKRNRLIKKEAEAINNQIEYCNKVNEPPKPHWAAIASCICPLLFFPSFILAAISVPPISSIFFVLMFVWPLLSIVFGIIGLKNIKNSPTKYKGKGFAIAGLIMGSILLIIMTSALIMYISMGLSFDFGT